MYTIYIDKESVTIIVALILFLIVYRDGRKRPKYVSKRMSTPTKTYQPKPIKKNRKRRKKYSTKQKDQYSDYISAAWDEANK